MSTVPRKIFNPETSRFITHWGKAHRKLYKQGILDQEGNQIEKKQTKVEKVKRIPKQKKVTPVVLSEDEDEDEIDYEAMIDMAIKKEKSKLQKTPKVTKAPKVTKIVVEPSDSEEFSDSQAELSITEDELELEEDDLEE